MVMDELGRSLRDALRKIINSAYIDEKIVNDVIRQIQRALITSDVEVKLVFNLTNRIKKRALTEKPPAGLTQREFVLKIVYEELVSFLGRKPDIKLDKRPLKIMLVGLFGAGKTTTVAKLAWFFRKKGVNIGAIGTDTWRPAAYEQLKQLSEQANFAVYGSKTEKNPAKILRDGLKIFSGHDVIIVDTAGRNALDEDFIIEAKNLSDILQADEVLLVIPADIGQNAKKQAQAFHDSIGITGVIITKLDGTAKGGGALSACAVTDAPVKFICTGEKYTDIELFDSEKFVSRLLGMGDIETLLRKAEEAVKESKIDPEAILKGKYTLMDFYDQLEAARKMGPMKQIMQYLGFGVDLPDELLKTSEEKMQKYKYILDSMTTQELENPKILNKKRIHRIAKGSGTRIEDVKELIQNYNQSRKLLKIFRKGRMKGDFTRIMKKMGGGFIGCLR